jgi:predicted N-acetyltransferase YhbS
LPRPASGGWQARANAIKIDGELGEQEKPVVGAYDALAAGGVSLRPMREDDLGAAQALTAELLWPHRDADWALAFRHGQGYVAERDGKVVATGLRWLWGERHATVGLIVVAPECQGRRIGHRMMTELLGGLDGRSVLLHATAAGRGLYERLGFRRIGEVRQHQGVALPSPPIALDAGWRLRPATQSDRDALVELDARARGMPREPLIAELLSASEASVVLDHDGERRGFALLWRFGRGHAIGPVVASDIDGAKAMIAHLSGLNAGRFTRIDIDFDSGLSEWVETLGLLRVDAPTAMLRGPALETARDARLFAIALQAFG